MKKEKMQNFSGIGGLIFFQLLFNALLVNAADFATLRLGRAVTDNEVLVLEYTLQSNTRSQLLALYIQTEQGRSENYQLQLQSGTHRLYWYPTQYSSAIRSIFIRSVQNKTGDLLDLKDLALNVFIEKAEAEVRPASLFDMMNWKASSRTRDFTAFRWQQYPEILVFFFRDKAVQARYLKRIAFFTEKRGTRTTIQYDSAIAHRTGWGAHDYAAEDLQRFFELGRTNDFPLLDRETGIFPFHKEELELKRLLIEENLLLVLDKDRQALEEQRNDYSLVAHMPIRGATGAIVSIAESYSPALIQALLTHELLHTFYFQQAALRSLVNEQWNSLSSLQKKVWRGFLARNGYDETHEYLVANEFFAYLLQRPISQLRSYLSARIIAESGLALDKNTEEAFISSMLQIARALEQYMQNNFSISAGNLEYLRQH